MLGDGLARQLNVAPGDGVTLLASTIGRCTECARRARHGRVLHGHSGDRQAARLHRRRHGARAGRIPARQQHRHLPACARPDRSRAARIGAPLQRPLCRQDVAGAGAFSISRCGACTTASSARSAQSSPSSFSSSPPTPWRWPSSSARARSARYARSARCPANWYESSRSRARPWAASARLLGALIALGISIVLLFAGLEMPPAPGRSTGYPLQIAISPVLYTITMIAITILSMLCSAAIASRTANKPIVEALGHV